MMHQLKRDPRSSSDASRAEVLWYVAMIVGGAGGALIGVPIGQAAAGERRPPWALAGVGAGVTVGSIAIAVWSDSSMQSAIEEYNKTRSFSHEVSPLEGAGTPGAGRGRGARPAPPEAFGFVFGGSKTSTVETCRRSGHEWGEEEGAGRCTGTPAEGIPGAPARLEFAGDRLSAVELVIRPPEDAQGWVNAFRETESALMRIHGKAQARSFVLPDECKAAEQFLGCVAERKVTGSAQWSLAGGRSAELWIAGSPAPSTICVRVTAGPPKG